MTQVFSIPTNTAGRSYEIRKMYKLSQAGLRKSALPPIKNLGVPESLSMQRLG
jgi:hypothetical protein